MPGPLSATEMATIGPSLRALMRISVSAGVYWMALLMRLVITCTISRASALTSSSSIGSISMR